MERRLRVVVRENMQLGKSLNSKPVFQTSFLASKKLFKCFICQNPIANRTPVCMKAHHSTRWFVLSLVCLNRSSLT